MFEDEELRVVALLDPLEGQRYVEHVNSEGQGGYLDHIYNITYEMDDYVNPTSNIKLSWRSVSSCTSDSREAFQIIGRTDCMKCP